MTGLSERRWYVVQTQPNREGLAETHLRRQAFETFQPLQRRTTRHARQFRTREAPLFPRYLFVAFDIGRDRWRSINGTLGVVRLLTAGNAPLAVPRGTVEQLQAEGLEANPISGLGPGQPVRVNSGPLAGLVGRLMKLDATGRVEVLLQLLGGEVLLQADAATMVPAA
ncbi:MAG: transcription termination/antitermination protein NusG [Bauldia sp.]